MKAFAFKNTALLKLILAVIAGYSLFYALLVGLPPLDPIDDALMITTAKNASWARTFEGVTSLGAGTMVPGGYAQWDQEGFHSRWGQTLITKILYTFAGENLVPYAAFQILCIGCILSLLSTLVFRFTQSIWLVAAFAALYLSSPAFTVVAMWFADWTEQVQLLILIAFTLALNLYPQPGPAQQPPLSAARKTASIIFIVILALFAMRSRADGYMIPLSLGCLLLVHHAGSARNRWIFLCLSLLALGVFLTLPREVTEAALSKFNARQSFEMLFMNQHTVHEVEHLPALIDPAFRKPVSLLRHTGFLLGWLSLLSALFVWRKGLKMTQPGTRLMLIWLAWVSILFAIPNNQPRYLIQAWTPLTVLIMILMRRVWTTLSSRRAQQGYAIVCALVIGVTAGTNLIHAIHWRNLMAQSHYMQTQIPQIVFNDYHERPLETKLPLKELYGFYSWHDYMNARLKVRFTDLVVVSDDVNYAPRFSPDLVSQTLQKQGKAYAVLFSPQTPAPEGFRLIWQGSIFKSSPLLDMIYRIRPKHHTPEARILVASASVQGSGALD